MADSKHNSGAQEAAMRLRLVDRRAIHALLAHSARPGAAPFTVETDDRGETVAFLEPRAARQVRS